MISVPSLDSGFRRNGEIEKLEWIGKKLQEKEDSGSARLR
jgi:hypothetical protein